MTPQGQTGGTGPVYAPPPAAPATGATYDVTGTYPAPGGAVPAAPFAETKPKKRKGLLIAGGVAAAVVLVGGAAFVGTQVLGGDDSEPTALVISEPSSSEEEGGDLSLVELGDDPKDAEVFAKDAYTTDIFEVPDGTDVPDDYGSGIVKVGSAYLIAWNDADQTTVALVEPGADEPKEVLYEEDGYASVTVDAAHEHVAVGGDESGCYVGPTDGELDRVSRAGTCSITPAGTVIAYDYDYDEEEATATEVGVYSLDGDELASFEATDPEWTDDGNYVVSNAGDEVALIEASSGDEVSSVDGDSTVLLDSTGGDGRVLVGITGEDEASLVSLSSSGDADEIVSGPAVAGQQVRGSDVVIGAVDDGDGNITLSRFPASGGDGEELLDDEGIGFEVIDQPEPALIVWNADGDLWGGSAASGDLVELGSLDDGVEPSAAVYDPSSKTGYLVTYDADASESAVLRIADGDLDSVIDGWSNISLSSGDASQIVVNAYDEDEDTIITITGADDVDVASADRIGSITAQGSDLVYATYDGEDEDPAVAQVPADGSEDPTEIFEGYTLSAVSWAQPATFQAYLGSDEYESDWVGAGGSCGDVDEWEDYAEGDIDYGGVTACIVVPSGGASVVIDIDADVDTELEVFDEDGESAAYSDDDDDGFDPYIDTYLDEGVYSVDLSAYYEDEFGYYEAYITIDG